MKTKRFLKCILIVHLIVVACANAQSPAVYTIEPEKIEAHIEPTMYGIFFEDINMAADGGVYAELVKNRSFEFDRHMAGWQQHNRGGVKGNIKVIDRSLERPENSHILNVKTESRAGSLGLSNEGFHGMGIKKGEVYSFSVTARQMPGSKIKLLIELRGPNGKVIGTARLTPTSTTWEKYNVRFTAKATENNASLFVWLNGKGNIDLDMVSLFPKHTWKNRPAGLRADLVQKLADLKPGFLRFPGGCIVEGRELATRYQWKKSIGDIDSRENLINRWNTEFKHRPAPDYYQTFGLGFMEYFLTAEDIGAEPLPILNCGMACQFNTGQLVPLNELDPYIQDALDLIEFANGGLETKWGKLRATLGHPKPFNLKMLGVGNEQWGEQYISRWKIFTKAIKDKYPYIKIISSLGPNPNGDEFNKLNKFFRSVNADILDEHYYQAPKWFFDNAKRYDDYDRNGPKIFAGEYAAQSVAAVSPDNKNNWECALAEAAFMTGLERNAYVVHMASYAPLFAHVDGWQWTPNLIWFDNLRSYATPSYYVQQLFSLNKGTDVVKLMNKGEMVSGQDGMYATASIDMDTKELIVKIVNSNIKNRSITVNMNASSGYKDLAQVITLGNYKKDAVNSLNASHTVFPENSELSVNGKSFTITMEPLTFKIVRLKIAKL